MNGMKSILDQTVASLVNQSCLQHELTDNLELKVEKQ